MEKYVAKRMDEKVKLPGLFEIYAMALARERAGADIVHMEIGRPDFDTPERIKQAAKQALDDGLVYYSEPLGILPLREAIVKYTKRMTGVEYDPMTQVVVTIGASEALDAIWAALLNPEDEIILPSPFYGAYTKQLEYADKKYKLVPILKEGGVVEYRKEDFEAVLTPNTKMILINSPNNPTGYVMTDEEIQMIADFATEHDLLVISDDCYDNYVFEGEFKSIAALPGMKDRTLIVNSTSKTFSMTGWRVGYVIGHPAFINAILRVHAQTVVCPAIFAQVGAAVAYGEEIPEVADMFQAFLERKEYIAQFLKTIPGIKYVEPKGAFYIFMDVSSTGMRGFEFCEKLLQDKGVTLSPGNNFGLEWDNYVRISYACSMDDIKKAMDRLKEFFEENKA